MTTKAQLYLNEQTTERSFEEELAAKDREIARLRTLYEEQLDHCAGVIAKQDREIAALREEVGNAAWHAFDAALSSRLNERLTALGLVSPAPDASPSRVPTGVYQIKS